MQIDKIIRFNTGRQYSDKGQRIAAAEYNGVVIMVDVDRGLDYVLPDATLDRESIIDAYDYSDTCRPLGAYPEIFNGDYVAMFQFVAQLRDHAHAFPGCLLPK